VHRTRACWHVEWHCGCRGCLAPIADLPRLATRYVMPFSETQRTRFVALLQTKDWHLLDSTIWSTSGGLWFDDSHFEHWNPSQMREVFSSRAAHIAKAQVSDWQRSTRENREAAWAAEGVAAL